jgi:hypothetical protein
MDYFPQHKKHNKTFTVAELEKLLREVGLLSPEAHFTNIEMPKCYCDPNDYFPCSCLPESLTFTWYTIKENFCETCGATGTDPCVTKSGRKTSYHKTRKQTEI